MEEDNKIIRERNEQNKLNTLYNNAVSTMNTAKTEAEYKSASKKFIDIISFKDSEKLHNDCLEKAENARKDAIYNEAKSKMIGENTQNYENAISIFQKISGWKDTDEQIYACQQRIEEIKAKEEADRLEAERRAEEKRIAFEKTKEKIKKIAKITTPIVAIVIAFIIILNTVIIPKSKYNKANELYKSGNTLEALETYYEIPNYKDVFKKINSIIPKTTISADEHTVGLKTDGTVVANGKNYTGQCDVYDWTDIVEVSANCYNTVGLKSDGTVIAIGDNCYSRCDVDDWTDIVAISTGGYHTVGLKSDGTVVAVGSNLYGQCDVQGWTNIVAISAGGEQTVGLKSDGTVVAIGQNYENQCDVESWTNIVAISAGANHTVGLKDDGTVIAIGRNYENQCNVDDWTDIVAVSTSGVNTVGLKSDGTVVAVGSNDYGECDVKNWKDIKVPEK